MTTKQEERERARAERAAQADAAAALERRNRRLWQVGSTVVVAAALVIVAIAISSGGKQHATPPRRTQGLFSGVPQQGVVLGSPRAPLTMIEFADLQCPFCRQYAVAVLPALVTRYVRTGRVKMVFRNLTGLGPDSVKAARAAAAAGLQNKLWNFIDRFYQEQGPENSGYVTDAFIRRIGGEVPGLDVPRLLAARASAPVSAQLAAAFAQGKVLKPPVTPSFYLQRGAAKPARLEYSSYEASEFSKKIDAALSGR